MKSTRRMKRMARAGRNRVASLSLTSLMDVFTILVLYLLVNQSSGTVLDPPKNIKLPESIVEALPRETVTVAVSDEEVVIKGVMVATVQEILENKGDLVETIRDRMAQIKDSAKDQVAAQNIEVTILASRNVHFKVLKRVMASCTSAGYTKISLAVNQK
jgi:biopolymer transport protein ExbD